MFDVSKRVIVSRGEHPSTFFFPPKTHKPTPKKNKKPPSTSPSSDSNSSSHFLFPRTSSFVDLLTYVICLFPILIWTWLKLSCVLSGFCSLSFLFLLSTYSSTLHCPLFSTTTTTNTTQLTQAVVVSLHPSLILSPLLLPVNSLHFPSPSSVLPFIDRPSCKTTLTIHCISAFIFFLPLSLLSLSLALHSFFGQNPQSFGCVVQP